MQINANQLSRLDKQAIAPLYLISGDCTLQIQKTRDHLRTLLKKQQFDQYHLKHVGTKFDWQDIANLTQNIGLFSEKTLIDLRNEKAKFDKSALSFLQPYFEDSNPDNCIIITTDKLTATQKKSKWFKLIDQHAVCITIWPVNPRELPQWIQQHAQALQLKLTQPAVQLLAQLTEGNLLATDQALQKLQLLFKQETILPEHVSQAMSDNARFSVFDLGNYCLAGHAKKALAVLDRLKQTSTEPVLVLWSLSRELHELHQLLLQQHQGVPIAQALQRQWASRRTLLQQAVKRLKLPELQRGLHLAHQTDLSIKGFSSANTWDLLADLILLLCGVKCEIRS